MRLRALIMVLAAACLLLVTGGPSSHAEGDSFMTRDPTLQRGRGFFNLFQSRPAPRQVEPQRRAAPQPRRPRPVVVRDDPVIPKVDIAHHVLVIGDSLGDLIATGLTEALTDRGDVAVLRRARPDSGLVRTDFYDWPKAVQELLAGDPKIMVGVIALGTNDRQAIREGETIHEPLSERWLELYRQRIELVTTAFASRRIPLIWMGVPPMQNTRLSADMASFNDLYRKSVEMSGGHYVDLWSAYLDAENRYTAMGPDVDGQPARLRAADGVHFTRAGARKAAHFAEVIIRRLLEKAVGDSVIATPGAPLPEGEQPAPGRTGTIEQLIDQMVGSATDALALVPVLPPRPLAGPILPLTGPAALVGEPGLLATIADARGRGEAALRLDRVFGEGVTPEPRPGRADDFRWPRAN